MKRRAVAPAVLAVIATAAVIRRGYWLCAPLLFGAKAWWSALHRDPAEAEGDWVG